MDILSIKGVSKSHSFRHDNDDGHWLEFRPEKECLIASAPAWESLGGPTRLALLAIGFTEFVAAASGAHASVTFLFSGKVIRQPDAQYLWEQWTQNYEPPSREIIDFVRVDDDDGASRLTSVGLTEIIGHEVDGVIDGDTGELFAALNYLAFAALTEAMITMSHLTSPSGNNYELTFAQTPLGKSVLRATPMGNVSHIGFAKKAR